MPVGEQPGREGRGAAQRAVQAGDVHQIDADANDHSPSLPRRCPVPGPTARAGTPEYFEPHI